MSTQFWFNLQSRYDLEVTEDSLSNRLDEIEEFLSNRNEP